MYDIAKGRPSRIDVEWNPFQRLDTPFRAQRAARLGALAGWVIAGDYLVTALIISNQHAPVRAVLSSSPVVLALIHALLGLCAAALAFTSWRRPKLWISIVLFVWAVWELLLFPPAILYAHAAPRPIAILILTFAILGFRGVLALRKLAAQPEPPPTA